MSKTGSCRGPIVTKWSTWCYVNAVSLQVSIQYRKLDHITHDAVKKYTRSKSKLLLYRNNVLKQTNSASTKGINKAVSSSIWSSYESTTDVWHMFVIKSYPTLIPHPADTGSRLVKFIHGGQGSLAQLSAISGLIRWHVQSVTDWDTCRCSRFLPKPRNTEANLKL